MITDALAPAALTVMLAFVGGTAVVLSYFAVAGRPGRRRGLAWFGGFFAALAVMIGSLWLLT